ncbi:MAG: hypothetical protein WCA19_10495 [Candidatus Acidiferrales bacterium]
MAMTIFFVLNGLGVIFLLYVLANFWKEGHRPQSDARKHAMEFGRLDWADVFVMTHPISHSAQGGVSVIPFQTRTQYSNEPARGAASSVTQQAPARRFSTR